MAEKTKYEALSSSPRSRHPSFELSASSAESDDDHTTARHPWSCRVIALLFSNTILVILSVVLLYERVNLLAPDLVFSTDFAPSRTAIHYEQQRFSGSLNYNTTTGELFREVNLSQAQYFGRPSPEIDSAWRDLLKGALTISANF
jgi:hypothetical protein